MKFDKALISKVAALAVAVLTVYGLSKYSPLVDAVKDVLYTQVQDGAPAPAPAPVQAVDAGL